MRKIVLRNLIFQQLWLLAGITDCLIIIVTKFMHNNELENGRIAILIMNLTEQMGKELLLIYKIDQIQRFDLQNK